MTILLSVVVAFLCLIVLILRDQLGDHSRAIAALNKRLAALERAQIEQRVRELEIEVSARQPSVRFKEFLDRRASQLLFEEAGREP